jgi:gamma-glutamyltranspeptidase/glutathione hydrolase/leukotriene-C4 hydrolase
MEDMANYSVIVKPALSGPFMGRNVYVPGAPTSGPVLLHMLRLAEKLGIADHVGDFTEKEIGRRVHLTVECMKCMVHCFWILV